MTASTIARTVSQSTDRAAQLERAIDRCTAAGIEPSGSGRLRDGTRFWIVPSQTEAGRLYVVTLHGHTLACNCPARVVCTHRASVVMELGAAAYRRCELAADIEDAMRGEPSPMQAAEDAAVAISAPRQRARGPLLDDVRGITIWKA